MKIWKMLGLAGMVGVAATGAVILRDQRQRADLTPDQIRERLHTRHAQVGGATDGEGAGKVLPRKTTKQRVRLSYCSTGKWLTSHRWRRNP